ASTSARARPRRSRCRSSPSGPCSARALPVTPSVSPTSPWPGPWPGVRRPGRAADVALPLPIRNRLAELILDAFDDPEAARTLRAVAAAFADDVLVGEDEARLAELPWLGRRAGRLDLLGALQEHRDAIRSRARAGVRALEAGRADDDSDGPSRLL